MQGRGACRTGLKTTALNNVTTWKNTKFTKFFFLGGGGGAQEGIDGDFESKQLLNRRQQWPYYKSVWKHFCATTDAERTAAGLADLSDMSDMLFMFTEWIQAVLWEGHQHSAGLSYSLRRKGLWKRSLHLWPNQSLLSSPDKHEWATIYNDTQQSSLGQFLVYYITKH